jgi:hypothetical protein
LKVSHVLYKVEDLGAAVRKFMEEGFVAEYGRSKKPYNALVYFSEGPYLELFNNSNMPAPVKGFLRLFGQGAMVDRMNRWETADEGFIGLALENYRTDLSEEEGILRRYGRRMFQLPSRRDDTKGRALRFRVGMPDDMLIPFCMTYFDVDPKPKDFVHPNGVVGIKSVSFGTKKEYFPLIRELCDDPILKLFVGEGVRDVEYRRK